MERNNKMEDGWKIERRKLKVSVFCEVKEKVS